MLLLALYVFAAALTLVTLWYAYLLAERARQNVPVNLQVWNVVDAMLKALHYTKLGFRFLTAPFFCMWMYLAHKNLAQLGARGLQFTSGWAAAAFFIPFANLIYPYQVAQEIYKASNPDMPPDEPFAWRSRSGSYGIGFWWAFWIGGNILGYFITTSVAGRNPVGEELKAAMIAQTMVELMTVVAALLAISMIYTIRRRQRRKQQQLLEEISYIPNV